MEVAVAGDVDRDGDVDLLVHNQAYGLDCNSLFLNTGRGRFVLAANQPDCANHRTTCMVLGDVDADLDLDLLIGNGDDYKGGGDVELRLNDGSGRFLATAFPTGYATTMCAVLGDTDGDGDLDAVVGNGADSDLWPSGTQSQLFLNDGAGGFSEATGLLPQAHCDTRAVALVDVDGDQDLDLVLANGGNAIASPAPSRLYLNDGQSHFSDVTSRLPVHLAHSLAVVAGDVDGDLDADLVFGDRDAAPRLYLNDGTGHYSDGSAQLPQHLVGAQGLGLADFDADGDLDLVGVFAGPPSGDGEFLALNDGNGLFIDASSTHLTDVAGPSRSAVVLDLDGDLDLDCVFLGLPSEDRLRFNDGSARLRACPAGIPFAAADGVLAIAGDLDGDHDLDVVSKNHVLLNDGTGWFAATDLIGTGGSLLEPRALGDVDGDQDPDLFVGVEGEPCRLYLNDGMGTFAPAPVRLPPSNPGARGMGLADIDGDGDLDALQTNYSGPLRLTLNDGTGVFSDASAQLPPTGSGGQSVLFADFDADGDADALVERLVQPALLLLNDGSGQFTNASAQFPQLLGAAEDAAGDLDGDGDLDVLSVGDPFLQTTAVRLHRNDGNASFGLELVPAPLPHEIFWDVELSDLDRDGDLDALLASEGSVQLLLNDGHAHFSFSALPSPSQPGTRLALGDFDLDGDDDAFVAVNQPGGAWLLSNLHLELAWREIPRVGVPLVTDLYGKPWKLWLMIGGRHQVPTPFPPFGLLQIAPHSAFVVAAGHLDSQGRDSASIPTPHSPAWIGATFYLQAFVGPPWRLTNVERVTLTGF